MKIKFKLLFLFFFILLAFKGLSQTPTRLIINQGFEQPSLGCVNCFNLFPVANVPGWETTDPTAVIEIWGTGFQSKNSHSGSQFAEINANNSAFLYQELCLAPNEVVNYSIWYLKRTTNTEQMRAQLAELNNNVISQSVVYTATNTWTNYIGTLTNNGTGGLKRIGFVAVTGGSTGNLIDDITISLRPIVSLKGFVPNSQNEGIVTNLNLTVNGTLTTSAIVNINLSGTAIYPNDFIIGNPTRGTITINSGNIVLNLPIGDYDPNLSSGTNAGQISIPITPLTDGINESNETITYTISSVSGGGATYPLVSGLNGFGADCSSLINSVTDTIKSFSPLPVELIYFGATIKEGKAELIWKTATEVNNDFFEIFSSDEFGFVSYVGRVQGNGTTSIVSSYAFFDSSPKNYYRICQVDFNGNKECFGWVATKMFEQKTNKFKIYDIYGRECKSERTGVNFIVDEYGKAKKIIIY